VRACVCFAQAAMPDDKTAAALLYFCLGCAVMISCVVGYMYLVRSAFAQHYLQKGSRKVEAKLDDRAEEVRCWQCGLCACVPVA
jgi:hypothetical protein